MRMKCKALMSKSKKPNGRAVNLYLTKEDVELASDLQKLEKRSLSNLVSVLLQREGIRTGLRKKAA